MSDLFHPDVPLDFIQRVFKVMADTPRHTYQILTKRSKRLASLANELDWPPNVWMGVSVESKRYAFRIDHLRSVPAAVRFISAEPLLGPLPNLDLSLIHWLIAGGESGHNARPMERGVDRSTYATNAQQPMSPSSSSNGEVEPPRPADASSTAPFTMHSRTITLMLPHDLAGERRSTSTQRC